MCHFILLFLNSSRHLPNTSHPIHGFIGCSWNEQRCHCTRAALHSAPITAFLTNIYAVFAASMVPDSVANFVIRRAIASILFFAAVCISCFLLYRAADSFSPQYFSSSVHSEDSPAVSEESKLDKVLKDAAMDDKTVILTTINEAWTAKNSIMDLFLESFKIGNGTRELLNNLVIIALDQKAFIHCLAVHKHCYALVTEGVDFSREAYFMTADYLKMMWRRIEFLCFVLELGYNFIFTDADIMWFRDPFPRFYLNTDFQIACDNFYGNADDINNRPNGGFLYVKSNKRSINFYKFWYSSREVYPGYHDQDVFNKIKNDSTIAKIGLTMKFLDTAYFGGFCEPSKDLNIVCTMHANCCFGMDSKLHDLRVMLDDWKQFFYLTPSAVVSWRVPQNCSLSSLRRSDSP